MQLSFQVHLEAIISVSDGLQGAAHLANLHVASGSERAASTAIALWDVLDHEAALQAAGLAGEAVLEVPLLVAETIDLLHNLLGLVNVTFLTLLLRSCDVEVDLLLELIDALVELLSLQLAHLVLRLAWLTQETLRVLKELLLEHLRLLNLLSLKTIISLHWVLRPGKRLLDLAIDGRNHLGQDVDEVALVLAGVRFPLRIEVEHLL